MSNSPGTGNSVSQVSLSEEPPLLATTSQPLCREGANCFHCPIKDVAIQLAGEMPMARYHEMKDEMTRRMQGLLNPGDEAVVSSHSRIHHSDDFMFRADHCPHAIGDIRKKARSFATSAMKSATVSLTREY
jgi:hypothetical protein